MWTAVCLFIKWICRLTIIVDRKELRDIHWATSYWTKSYRRAHVKWTLIFVPQQAESAWQRELWMVHSGILTRYCYLLLCELSYVQASSNIDNWSCSVCRRWFRSVNKIVCWPCHNVHSNAYLYCCLNNCSCMMEDIYAKYERAEYHRSTLQQVICSCEWYESNQEETTSSSHF